MKDCGQEDCIWRADGRMPSQGVDLRDLFTRWLSFKWSAALGIIMLFVGVGDVAFTLLNAEKYGLAYEANPLTRSMIGAGQPFILLWVVASILLTMLVYVLLVSFYLMLPTETREGRAATLVSALLAARISIVLYNLALFWYSVTESTVAKSAAAVIVVGFVLTFSIRFTMKQGDNVSWTSAKLALINLWQSLKSDAARFLSAIVACPLALFRAAKHRRTDGKVSSEGTEDNEGGAAADLRGASTERRRTRRIVIYVASMLAIPIILFGIMEVVGELSGISNLESYRRTLLTVGGQTQGTVFLVGFALALVSVGAMVALILALFDELKRGRPSS